MKKIKEIMRDVARVAASTYALAALALLPATAALAALPSGYGQSEFIQGDGLSAQIVIGDYTPQPNTDKIEAVVEWPENSIAVNVNHAVWCARGDGTQVDSWTLFAVGENFRFDYSPSGHKATLTAGFSIAEGTKYTITAANNTITYAANGTLVESNSTNAYTYTAGSPLMLFASRTYNNGTSSTPNYYGKFTLYSFKVWRSGTLIHDLVPAVRESDAKKGLYDVVANKFYVGSDSFKMGDFAFFSYDEGTALHGYQSYADWLASANVGASAESFTAESELEARYRTMGESDGIALRTDWGRPLIIIVR